MSAPVDCYYPLILSQAIKPSDKPSDTLYHIKSLCHVNDAKCVINLHTLPTHTHTHHTHLKDSVCNVWARNLSALSLSLSQKYKLKMSTWHFHVKWLLFFFFFFFHSVSLFLMPSVDSSTSPFTCLDCYRANRVGLCSHFEWAVGSHRCSQKCPPTIWDLSHKPFRLLQSFRKKKWSEKSPKQQRGFHEF